MKPNPPIKGHRLLYEGAIRRTVSGGHSGGCRCGAKPDGFPDVSAYAMKRWHRLHKEDFRAAMARHGFFTETDRTV
jgi:hypothetical protein